MFFQVIISFKIDVKLYLSKIMFVILVDIFIPTVVPFEL